MVWTCSLSACASRVLCIAVLTSTSFSLTSNQAPDALLHNKLGRFNFEELEQNVYSVGISSDPVVEPGLSTGGDEAGAEETPRNEAGSSPKVSTVEPQSYETQSYGTVQSTKRLFH